MIEDRLYRLLIPGSLYLISLLVWAVLDEKIPLLQIMKSLSGISNNPFGVIFVAGSLIVVVMVFLISEVAFTLRFIDASFRLSKNDKGRCWEYWTLLTHATLPKYYPELKNYLQRSWSHIVLGKLVFLSIISATLTHCLILSLVESNLNSAPASHIAADVDSNIMSIHLRRHHAMLAWFFVQLAILVMLHRNTRLESIHRSDLYSAVVFHERIARVSGEWKDGPELLFDYPRPGRSGWNEHWIPIFMFFGILTQALASLSVIFCSD